ncbi:MAG: Trk system potassium transporter TrkA [Lachnospiraceae bacterium]|nr:Trk system potassium transporter TrkA [Lachnospiraceae bacterium]
MKIIISGMGQTGEMLADILAGSGHDVVVIDNDHRKIEEITNKYSVSGVCGSCISRQILLKAGADTADVIVALTGIDEVNLMVCKLAAALGTRYQAARISQPEISSEEKELAGEFSVDFLINPKMLTADMILNQIGLPGKVKADAFFDNEACMVRVKLEDGMLPQDTITLAGLRQFFDCDMLVGTVVREDKLYVPKGDFEIRTGDVIGIIGSRNNINSILQVLGFKANKANNIFIIGAGDIAYYLTGKLLEEGKKVTLLDRDIDICEEVLRAYPKASVCLANGLKEEDLEKEGIADADVCISLTGSDEHNLVTSLFAWSKGIPSILTKVGAVEYEKLLDKVSMDVTISPAKITAAAIMGFIRNMAVFNEKGNDIRSITFLSDGKGEAIEFNVYDNSKCVDQTIASLGKKIRKGVLLALIIRNGECIIPTGKTEILEGDRLVVISEKKDNKHLNTVDDIFK